MMTGMTIKCVSDTREFNSLSEIWNGLLNEMDKDSSIYLTHEWLSTWWKYFGKGKKLNILLVEKSRRVIGIVPLMRTEYRIGLMRLHVLETIGASNCNYIALTSPGNREEVATALITYLEKELNESKHVLRFSFVPDDCSLLEILMRNISKSSKRLAIHEKLQTLAPYVPLPQSWDEYFNSLSGSRRRYLRRTLKGLRNEHNVEFQRGTADNLESQLRRFFDLHQARWRSVNVMGVFSDPRMKEFYLDIAAQFLEKEWLRFSFLTVDGEMVSGEYGFIYANKFYAATMGRDIGYSRYGVGHLHYMFLLEDAIKNHLREFDFLKGDEPYKFYWTKSARRYLQVVIVRKGLCARFQIKWLNIFLRLYGLRQYSLRDIYYLHMLQRKERSERKRMGL